MENILPSIDEIRRRIDLWHEPVIRGALMYQLMICGRSAEVVGKYGPRGSDARIVEFDGEEAVLFPVRTAKRGGRLRPVALPLRYEPYAEELYEFFQESGDDPVFPVSYRTLNRRAAEIFDGVKYPIEQYNKYLGKKVKVRIDLHYRDARTHFLRHTRAMDLLLNYNFDGVDLALYGGWTSKNADRQLPQVTQRYLHMLSGDMSFNVLQRMASRYFHKLCA